MPSRKRQCPRQAQMHRHCLDSLEIPYSHRCIFPRPLACQIQPPTCQVPSRACQAQSRACQVTPPACQIQPLNCQDPDPFRQVQPTSSQVKPPACQAEHPTCQTRHPACHIIPRLCHQLSPPCPVIPSTCQVRPPACQEPFPLSRLCQLTPPTFQNQPLTAMEHPICQWNQDFCPVGTCRSSTNCGTNRQSPHTFCHNYSNKDVNKVMYSDCFGPCTHQESGCENVEENDLDHPYLKEANTSNTNQNANTSSSYRNDEEISDQMQNISLKECVKSCQNECFSAAGSSNTEIISNADNSNNALARTNFRKAEGFSASGGYHDRNKAPNDINASRLLQSQEIYQDINKIPDSEIPSRRENSPQISDNSYKSNMCETTPYCRPGYFQKQALQPNFSTGNEAHFRPTEVAQNTSTTRKSSMSFQSEKFLSVSSANEPLETNSNISPADAQHVFDTSFDEMTPYRTITNIDNDNDEFQEHQTASAKCALQGQYKQYKQFSKDKNMNGDKHFELNSCCDATKEKIPHIVASRCPRSALKSPSSLRPKTSAKVHMRVSPNGTFMDCDTCCDVFDSRPNNNLEENFPPEYEKDSQLQSEHIEPQTRFANRSDQSIFENSVPTRGPKQFANCCDRGISGELTEPPEDIDSKSNNTNKDVTCVQEVTASSHALPTCDANVTVSGCECRYPPAFKQLSCAGNINGTCDCSDKNKI